MFNEINKYESLSVKINVFNYCLAAKMEDNLFCFAPRLS